MVVVVTVKEALHECSGSAWLIKHAFTPKLSVLEWKNPLLAADLSVGPCDAELVSEVDPRTMQIAESLITQQGKTL